MGKPSCSDSEVRWLYAVLRGLPQIERVDGTGLIPVTLHGGLSRHCFKFEEEKGSQWAAVLGESVRMPVVLLKRRKHNKPLRSYLLNSKGTIRKIFIFLFFFEEGSVEVAR